MTYFSRLIACLAIIFTFITFSSCQTTRQTQVLSRPNINTLNDSLTEITAFSDETIEKLLDKHKVNGASIAYINYNGDGWKRGYGYSDSKKTIKVEPTTQFQAASISKVLSSYSMMTLVDKNLFYLDMDLRKGLQIFGVQNQFPSTILSLRNLLKHKAGINYYKLKGYSRKDSLPTLENVLAGNLPAHNEAIQVIDEPYKTSKYSEGGYVLLEKIINERLKARGRPTPFSDIVIDGICNDLNMSHTSLGEPIDTNAIAFGHSKDGNMLEGKYFNYPEKAAGGVWTTAEDLAILAYEIGGYSNNSNKLLNKELAEEFVTDGLGVSYDSQKNIFGSFGRNEGYSCHFSFSLNKTYGIVIMTNSEDGGPFIADVYELINERYSKQKGINDEEE